MQIKNISDHTIQTTLFGRLLEIPSGHTISSKEFWGGEESVLILAIKNKGELKLMDDEGKEITEVICPVCGEKVKFAAEVKVEEKVEEIPVKIKRGHKK